MPKINVDGKDLIANDGESILNVCERNGIYIPRYCYHPSLSVAGNCRMCLVEIEKMPKLQTACSTIASEGMVVKTDSEKVRKARKDVLEFLLINHPLDCSICDQVGECFLQDYYFTYGLRKSRFKLENKNQKQKRREVGKYLVLDNERCILCTRCVRFSNEVTKTDELFVNSRGDRAFIDISPEKGVTNKYSLNIADICPVGAFTSKDFRFKQRVYMLQTTKSICTLCATGCKINIWHNNNTIYRITPEPNIYTNTWMCDDGRMNYKIVNSSERLTHSMINGTEYNKRQTVKQVFNKLSKAMDDKLRIAVVLSNYLSIEDNISLIYLAKNVLKTPYIFSIESNQQKIEDGILINSDKSPNSNGIKLLVKKYGIKDISEYAEYDIVIGFYEDIKNLRISPVKTILFSYKKSSYPCLIALKTYFETDGSFINWQGYLRKTAKVVNSPENTFDLHHFLMEVSHLFAVYPDFNFKGIIKDLKYKEEGQ
ncbi:MAG: (2Fe-2S)-binding protein [Elusimicrobiales bacterium]|jgi:NADH-quinone oxidoreductase subunit G|nr:(2Fe-2S)-binding protein [Elusimicrobiales bacterium]